MAKGSYSNQFFMFAISSLDTILKQRTRMTFAQIKR